MPHSQAKPNAIIGTAKLYNGLVYVARPMPMSGNGICNQSECYGCHIEKDEDGNCPESAFETLGCADIGSTIWIGLGG